MSTIKARIKYSKNCYKVFFYKKRGIFYRNMAIFCKKRAIFYKKKAIITLTT